MNETRLQELEKALQEPGEPRLSREFVQEMVAEIRALQAAQQIKWIAKCLCDRGAHEWFCSEVGEYDYVFCKYCDKPTWMSEMQMGLCRTCQDKFLKTQHP